MARRRLLRWALGAMLALVVGVGIAALASAEIRFLFRAGYEEGRLLSRRRSLERLVADPATRLALRDRFALVLAARAFAADSLGLEAGDTYTTYADIGRDTLVLVLSASPRLKLAVYSWWFPIVGSVPYHGYFSLDAALAAAGRLEALGLDTYVRPAGAFSTLGWFSDPLVSSALARDSVALVSTVIHEISHNTLYVPSATEFDESFANFVGLKGAEAFFRSCGETALANQAAAEWRDEMRLGEFYTGLSRVLDSVYALPVADSVKLGSRTEAFQRAQERMAKTVGPTFESYRAEWFAGRELNNATVIAARIYRARLHVFDRMLVEQGGDVRRTVRVIAELVKSGRGDPFGRVTSVVRDGNN